MVNFELLPDIPEKRGPQGPKGFTEKGKRLIEKDEGKDKPKGEATAEAPPKG